MLTRRSLVAGASIAQYKRFVASESEKFSKVILEAKISPEG
jgi:hypothetical protein